MLLVDRLIRRTVRSQKTLPLKEYLGKKLKEVYYNAEVVYRIESKTEPLNIFVDEAAPRRINILIPEINFNSFYGGYMAKFNLAGKLLETGFNVRLVVVDPSEYSPERWRDAVRDYPGLDDVFDNVDIAYQGDRKQALVISGTDRFIATTWWTAYLARHATEIVDGPPFLYLIQEYEPFTFPMGSYFATAHHSYSFAHVALFSSATLEEYFRQQNIGVFDSEIGDEQAGHFENAIVGYESSELDDRLDAGKNAAAKGSRKLLFYARPEAHATRNMFEVGFLALCRAIDEGIFEAGWEFHGIGSGHGNISLPKGNTLKMLGKFSLNDYRRALLDYDVGLSLMYTPHPSLLPLDMASAGMVVVTNTCSNKTRARLKQLSTNLVAAEPHIHGVVDGLREARRGADDLVARRAGARVSWASNWDESFNDSVMGRVKGWLE